MKRISFIVLFITINLLLQAQLIQKQDRSGIPFFDIIETNGSHFRFTGLEQGKPLMIVYFDPDCDHCEVFMKELLKNAALFNNVQIMLVTFVFLDQLKSFAASLNLAKYPQIKAGTEGNTFIVRYHYNVVQFPYLALHDKNGILFATFENEVPKPAELAKMFSGK